MKHKEIYINGIKVRYFHYNDDKEKLEAYDQFERIIAEFDMSQEQWSKFDDMSYAACWEELGNLFGDAE